MKKILTIFAFATTLFLGTTSMSAQTLTQDKSRPEVIAKVESSKLTESLGLNGDQSRAVFRALVAKEVSYQKSADGKDVDTAEAKTTRQKADATLKETMKKILTDEQYSEWVKTYKK